MIFGNPRLSGNAAALPLSPSRIAEWVSIALVPPTVSAAVFLALVLEFQHGTIAHRALVWLVAILSTGVIQIAYVLLLRSRGDVSAYDVPDRLQRTRPYLLSVGLSLGGLAVLAFMNASAYILALMWCFAVNTALLAVINRFWKISAHMMGLTGPLLFLIPVIGPCLLYAVPLIVLLGWARVMLRAHTLAQVLAGAAAGIVLTAAQILFIFRVGFPLLDG